MVVSAKLKIVSPADSPLNVIVASVVVPFKFVGRVLFIHTAPIDSNISACP